MKYNLDERRKKYKIYSCGEDKKKKKIKDKTKNQKRHMTFITTGADPDLIKLGDLPGIIS